MEQMTEKLMSTIDGTYERAKRENIGVTRNFIRQAAISGAIPVVKAGKVYLINWNNFMSFLSGSGSVSTTKGPEVVNGIRRVAE